MTRTLSTAQSLKPADKYYYRNSPHPLYTVVSVVEFGNRVEVLTVEFKHPFLYQKDKAVILVTNK